MPRPIKYATAAAHDITATPSASAALVSDDGSHSATPMGKSPLQSGDLLPLALEQRWLVGSQFGSKWICIFRVRSMLAASYQHLISLLSYGN